MISYKKDWQIVLQVLQVSRQIPRARSGQTGTTSEHRNGQMSATGDQTNTKCGQRSTTRERRVLKETRRVLRVVKECCE